MFDFCDDNTIEFYNPNEDEFKKWYVYKQGVCYGTMENYKTEEICKILKTDYNWSYSSDVEDIIPKLKSLGFIIEIDFNKEAYDNAVKMYNKNISQELLKRFYPRFETLEISEKSAEVIIKNIQDLLKIIYPEKEQNIKNFELLLDTIINSLTEISGK